MNAVIVFDADNTLWDTNAVFRTAQLELLRVFEKHGLVTSAEEELSTLRQIDQQLMSSLGNFEYDFVNLSRALDYYYGQKHTTLEQAVIRALGSVQELPIIVQDLIVRSRRLLTKH